MSCIFAGFVFIMGQGEYQSMLGLVCKKKKTHTKKTQINKHMLKLLKLVVLLT